MDIDDWRKKIDQLDEQIVQLITAAPKPPRPSVILSAHRRVQSTNPRREQAVFDHVSRINPGPLANAEILHVYERIIDVMRTLQRRNTKE